MDEVAFEAEVDLDRIGPGDIPTYQLGSVSLEEKFSWSGVTLDILLHEPSGSLPSAQEVRALLDRFSVARKSSAVRINLRGDDTDLCFLTKNQAAQAPTFREGIAAGPVLPGM